MIKQHQSPVPETPKTPVSLREEIALKNELKKKQEEEHLTFKPALISRSSRDSSTKTVAGSRFDNLYNDAVKRKTTGPKLDTSDLTFSPKINKANPISPTWKERDADIANRLYNAPGAGRPKPKEEKASSFEPKITKRAQSLERSPDQGSRLFSFEEVKRSKLEKAKEEAEKTAIADCTFKPKLLTSRSKSFSASAEGTDASLLRNTLDHVARLHKFEEAKILKLEELRKVKEAKELEGVTFKPQISTSKRAPSLDGRPGTVYERLNSHVSSVDPKVIQELDSELTFKPYVYTPPSPAPRATSAERNAKYGGLHSRLHHEGLEKRKEQLEEVKKDVYDSNQRRKDEQESFSFQPTVPLLKTSSMKDINSDAGSVATSAPVFDRLSTSKQYMQNILTQIKADLEMSECTFKPTITELGKSKKDSEPVHTRLLAKATEMEESVRRREEEKVALELADATFSPHLPESSQKMAKKKSLQNLLATSSGGSVQGSENIFVRLNSHLTMARNAPSSPPEHETTARPGSPLNKKAFVRRSSGHSLLNGSMEEGNLLERFAAHEERKKEEILRKQEELLAEQLKEVTFAPAIPQSSEKLARKKSMSEIGKEETSEEKFLRLNSTAIGKSDHPPSGLMDATFSPHLNSNTEAIARRKIVELASATGSSGKVFDRLSLGSSADSSSSHGNGNGLLRTASRSSNVGANGLLRTASRSSNVGVDGKPTSTSATGISSPIAATKKHSPKESANTPPSVRGKVVAATGETETDIPLESH